MKINGKLIFGASSASEIQNLRVQKVLALPAYTSGLDSGRLVYNTDTSIMYYGDDATDSWIPIATGGNAANLQAEVDRIEAALGAAVAADGSLVDSAFAAEFAALGGTPTSFTDAINKLAQYVDANNTLVELDDVAITSVQDNALLQYDAASGKWIDADIGSDSGVQKYDAGLDALADKTSTGMLVQTGGDTYESRSLVQPAEGLVITNADGVAGNPTFALANDLAALEGLTTQGQIVRTGDGTAVTRSLEGVAGNTVVTNGDGVLANPKVDLAEVTQADSGTFKKFTTDAFGRVVAQTPVLTADITALVDATYVNATGDTMTGALAMSDNKITGVAAPTAGTDATNKNYVDALVAGLSWKHAVRVATSANIALIGAPATIDGVTLVAGDRVLVKAQTASAENGIYVFDGADLVRADDMSDAAEFSAATVYVQEGTSQADTGWTQTSEVASVGTDSVTFVQFTGNGTFVAGVGLDLTGNTFSVNLGAGIGQLPTDEVGIHLHDAATGALVLTTDGVDRSTATGAALHLRLNAAGALAQDVDGLKIAANSVTNDMLVNEFISLAGDTGTGSVDLGSTITVSGTTAQGIETSVAAGEFTITALDASTTQKGVASFDAGHFAVVAGAVSLDASLDDLNNVAGADAAAVDSVLTKGATEWEPVTRAALVGSTSVGDHNDVALTSPVDGQALVYDGSNFVNQKVFHIHDQASAATTWTVTHNLGQKYCNVVIVDDQDEVIIPESIKFDSTNSLTVTFNTAVAGKVVVAGVA